jgi:uncharacterized protein YoxC
MLTTLRSLAGSLCLLAIGTAALWVAWSIMGARQDLRASQDRATASLQAMAGTLEQTRKDLAGTQAAIVGILDKRTGDLTDQAHQLVEAAAGSLSKADSTMEALAKIPAGVSPVLTQAQATIAEFAKVPADLRPVLTESAATVRDIHPRALELVRGWKTAGNETALTMSEFRKSAPVLIDAGHQLIVDSSAVATNLEQLTHPRWYDRLLGYGLNGLVMYRSLNPATNLTIKGAQVVAARP